MSEIKWQRLSIESTANCGQHTFPLGADRYALCGEPATWVRRNPGKKPDYACADHASASFPLTDDELITAQRTMDTEARYARADLPAGWREWISPNKVSHAVPPTGPCVTCGMGRHETDERVPEGKD